MGKLVVLKIEEGNFEHDGFPVNLQIGNDGASPFIQISGMLPPCAEIPQKYKHWQSIYLRSGSCLRLGIPTEQVTNLSITENLYFLHNSINTWLNSEQFNYIKEKLLTMLLPSDEIRVLIQTENFLLQRLPWHLWNFFEQYPKAEVALSTIIYEKTEHSSLRHLRNPVKILAILGNSTAINVQEDYVLLEKLRGAQIDWLIEPNRKDLIDKLWGESWDILFFAGHSSSEPNYETARIYINKSDSLTTHELKLSLKKAISNGLKIAIFNSCDGLGLAKDLAELNMPQFILMREPVPDQVAQNFLKYFLEAFARGELFYLAVREARERLQELESEFPCASWLPVIFQNPAAAEFRYPQPPNWKKIAVLTAIVTISVGCLGAIVWRTIDEIRFRERFSSGEKILVNQVATLDKKAGVQAFWWKNYNQAVNKFESSLQQNPNDPETLVYLNNAKIGNKKALTIGVAVPIGKNPNIAQEILRGVAQAQREINNQGGINGKFIEVEIANDDNEPKIAKQVAHRFVQDENILAVVGHNSSDASVPASDIYQAGKLVMISPTSASTKLTDRTDTTDGNYIYRTVFSFNFSADNLAKYAKNARINKILLCDDSKATDQSFNQAFVIAISNKSFQHVNNISCDFASVNFSPQAIIKSAQANQVDAILLSPQVDRISKAIEVAKASQGKFRLLGNPSLQTETTLNAGNAVKGMVMAVPWQAAVSPNKDFVQNANNLWHEPDSVTWRTATAFDATKAIAAALKQKENNRNGVQQAFSEHFSLQGATGTIQFLSWGDREGDRVGNVVLVEVQPDANARTGYSFVPKDSIQSRISLGDKILVKDNPSSEKQLGVQVFADRDYEKAIAAFKTFLRKIPNDPEARIYLQNAFAARSGKILKIAVSVPIGSNLNVAKEMLQGVAQAQDEVNNKGGIQGHLLQVEIASDDNNPEIAKQLANIFVQDQQILAVIGHNASDASVAACETYQEGKLVNISPTSFSLKLSGCGSYIFRTAPNIRFIADALSKYAINNVHTKTLAICVDEKAIDNQSFRDEFLSSIVVNRGQIVNIKCDLSAPDFNPNQVITDAILSGADGLVLAPHIDRINKALDITTANKGRLKLFGSPTLYTSQTLQQGQADVNGLMLAVPWYSGAYLGNDFGKNALAMWGSPVTWRSATSYDATIAVIRGLQQSKTRQELQQVLRSPNFYTIGATGKIQFLPSGDRYIKNDVFLVQVQLSKASPTGYKFSLLNPANTHVFKRDYTQP